MSYFGIYFSVWRFRTLLDKRESMPWKSQRRQVGQPQEETLAGLSARLHCGEKAPLPWAGMAALAGPQHPCCKLRNLSMYFCTAPQQQAGQKEQNLNPGHRKRSSGKRAFLFPPGSLLISILIFNMHVEARTNITSWMTNFKQWRLRHSPLTDTGGNETHEHLQGAQFSKATYGLYLTFRLGVGQLIEAETRTRLDLAQGKVGLETVCPPFWVRTKVDTLTQDWWLLWELALLLTVRMIASFSQQWPWHRIHHSWGKGKNRDEMIC